MVEQVTIQEEETTAEAPQEDVKAAESKTEEVVEEQQPDKILGKFESQEDLEKAYKELESKVGAKAEVKEPTEETDLEIKQVEDVVENAGLDMDSLQNEFLEKGELADESLAKLEKVGISKDIVNAYIKGQQAISQQTETEVKNIAGGNEGYAKMISWAKDNLSAEEIVSYNDIVNGADIGQTRLAVAGLKARMNATAEPNLIRGKAASVSTDSYDNWSQVSADMSKPEYANDPAEQARVSAKLAKSNL